MLVLRGFTWLATFTCLAVAQQSPPDVIGYGRFPCTQFDADNAPLPDQSACSGTFPFPDPSSPAMCVLEPQTGFYFCGIEGAACTSGANCDYGRCQNGVCTGGFGDPADGDYANCLGNLASGRDGNCGSVDANCYQLDQYCTSGFCGYYGLCHAAVQVGDACLTDDSRICGPSLYAWRDHATGACTCQATPPPTASQRARARRNTVSLCPATFSACELGTGYECIDTRSNLERCGGCNDETGGVDCTALPGVEAVGCVDGQCEIWACATGFDFDAQRNACVAV